MWKTIQFEPNYEVSDLGEIRNKLTLQVKSLRLNKQGYSRVTLYPSGKTYTVHRLVALTFLSEKFEEGLVVNHKDGVKTNNNVDNLEWATNTENMRHAFENGVFKERDKTSIYNIKHMRNKL